MQDLQGLTATAAQLPQATRSEPLSTIGCYLVATVGNLFLLYKTKQQLGGAGKWECFCCSYLLL